MRRRALVVVEVPDHERDLDAVEQALRDKGWVVSRSGDKTLKVEVVLDQGAKLAARAAAADAVTEAISGMSAAVVEVARLDPSPTARMSSSSSRDRLRAPPAGTSESGSG